MIERLEEARDRIDAAHETANAVASEIEAAIARSLERRKEIEDGCASFSDHLAQGLSLLVSSAIGPLRDMLLRDCDRELMDLRAVLAMIEGVTPPISERADDLPGESGEHPEQNTAELLGVEREAA